jgi:hypothetical protein
MAAGGVDRANVVDRTEVPDRAALRQAPGSDCSPARVGARDGAGGEIRGGGAVLESSGSFTEYRGRRKPLTSRTISTTVRIGSSRRGRKRKRKNRANQRNIGALSH